jgi:hypothetical protein
MGEEDDPEQTLFNESGEGESGQDDSESDRAGEDEARLEKASGVTDRQGEEREDQEERPSEQPIALARQGAPGVLDTAKQGWESDPAQTRATDFSVSQLLLPYVVA